MILSQNFLHVAIYVAIAFTDNIDYYVCSDNIIILLYLAKYYMHEAPIKVIESISAYNVLWDYTHLQH